jgi:hypothetical protein
MSIEDSICTLAHAISRLADAINASSTIPTPAAAKPATTKPKAEPKPELPIATASEVVADAAAKPVESVKPAEQVVAAAPAAEAPTYDSTRALMLQVSEKFGRDCVISLLGQCGLQDLKKGTPAQFAAVTAAATAQLAGV